MNRTMLLDTASLYFRAFYGVPDKVRTPDGRPANAVRGLLDIIAKLITEYRPDSVVACWDDDWRPAWRVDLVPSYKAQRVAEAGEEEVPADLLAQIPAIRTMLSSLGITIVGHEGYEADDIIGTLAHHAIGPVDVVTGDRDLFQVIDDERDVRVIYTARGMSNLEVVTDAVVLAKYGVHAAQYADFATLRGDASDGLPGAAGIGEKTAATLLQTHGTLAGALTAAESGTGMTAAVARKLLAAADYLEVAPAVVAVARGVAVHAPDSPLAAPEAAQLDVIRPEAEREGYASALDRYLKALTTLAA